MTDGPTARREAVRYFRLDTIASLLLAMVVNCAILIVAGAIFHGSGHRDVAEIGDAYRLLTPLLGTTAAAILFGVALLASGRVQPSPAPSPDRSSWKDFWT